MNEFIRYLCKFQNSFSQKNSHIKFIFTKKSHNFKNHISICNPHVLVYTRHGTFFNGSIVPSDVIEVGLYTMSICDVLSVSAVNKRLHGICFSETLWEHLVRRDRMNRPNNTSQKNPWFNAYKISYISLHGKCKKCNIHHNNNQTPLYHPGTWHGYSYREYLQQQESAAVVAQKGLDGSVFVAQMPLTMVVTGGKGVLKVVAWGAVGAAGAVYLGYSVGGALGAVGGTLIAAPILVASVVGGVLYGTAKLLAAPFVASTKVLGAINKREDVRTKAVFGLHKWTCCGHEGSWAVGCTQCTKFSPM